MSILTLSLIELYFHGYHPAKVFLIFRFVYQDYY